MPTEAKMTIDERYKYLQLMQRRYRQADKVERGRLLNEMERVTGCHRKGLVRQMSGELQRRKQRGRTHGVEVQAALHVIAESHDYLCAERLQPNLVVMAEQLAAHGELTLTRSYRVMEDGFVRILTRLPFVVHEIHTDNGSEFLNHHLLRFWPRVNPAIHLSTQALKTERVSRSSSRSMMC